MEILVIGERRERMNKRRKEREGNFGKRKETKGSRNKRKVREIKLREIIKRKSANISHRREGKA